jgi:RHS repeat-associated protein
VTEGALPAILGSGLPAALGSVAVAKLEYWHKDHLGSLIATTNHVATVTGRYSYDPFGKRRVITGTYDPFGNVVVDWGVPAVAGADRGYTGHEHLDDVGVIHMNGRVFDPLVGRFMQADPLVQDPGNLQNYDRYAYCFNSPTTCTDPSGYASLRQMFRAMDNFVRRPNIHTAHNVVKYQPWQKSIDRFLMDNEFAYTVARIVVAYFTLGFGTAGFDGYYTYERTGSATAAFKTAAVGVATNLAFMAVGSMTSSSTTYFDGMNDVSWTVTTTNVPAAIMGHAVVGCASAEAGGGNCGEGALAAGFGKAMTLAGPSFVQNPQGLSGVAAGTAYVAFSGGVASVLGGGKFANGAQTAAMGYLFNHLAQRGVQLLQQAWGRLQMLAASPGAQLMTHGIAGEVGVILPNVSGAGGAAVSLFQRAIQRGYADVQDGVIRQFIYTGDDAVILLRRDFGQFNHGTGDHYNLQVFVNNREVTNIHYHVDSTTRMPISAWDSRGSWNGGRMFYFENPAIPKPIGSP